MGELFLFVAHVADSEWAIIETGNPENVAEMNLSRWSGVGQCLIIIWESD